MARRRRAITVRRSGGSRTADKLRSRLAASSRRRAQEKKQRFVDMAAVGGGAALGFIDRQGWENPLDIPGVPDAGVYAAGLYLAGDRFVSGKMGELMRGLGVGMMACAMRDLVDGKD